MDKITVIGFTSSGKTSYLVGMYDALSYGLKEFSLSEMDNEVDLYLQKVWENIRSRGEFPLPTDEKETYRFSLMHAFKPIRNFEWLDYPGSVLTNADTLLNDLSNQLSESACLLLLVNGESFAFQGNPKEQKRIQASSVNEYKRIVAQNLKNNHDLQAIKQLNALGAQGIDLPPIAIVLTKSDLIEDEWAIYAKDILCENFGILFAGPKDSDRIVMIEHTSLGNMDSQNGFATDPINIELPIAFGVLSILRQDVIKNKLLNVHNQDQMNVHQKNWFTKWLNSDSIAKLREESQKRMEDIKAASVDVFNLLSLFEDDKPIYINGEEKNLKDFFKKELQ